MASGLENRRPVMFYQLTLLIAAFSAFCSLGLKVLVPLGKQADTWGSLSARTMACKNSTPWSGLIVEYQPIYCRASIFRYMFVCP